MQPVSNAKSSLLNRRRFGLGAAPLIAPAVLSAGAPGGPSRYASRLRFTADGSTTFSYVVFNPSIPFSIPPLPQNADIRVRTIFPYQERDVLYNRVYVADLTDPTHTEMFPVSEFMVAVEDIDVGDTPSNTLAFFCRVIANPVLSPFGVIVGRVCSMGCQFTEGNPASFEFIGGYVAGSHATFVPSATGELYIQRPWQSF